MSAPYEGDSSNPSVPGLKGLSHAANGGVVGVNDWSPTGQPAGTGGNGGWFESTEGEGVRGWSKNPNHGGVVGVNTAKGIGVFGQSDGNGGWFESTEGEGVRGWSKNPNHGGVVGVNTAKGNGVFGQSDDGIGVRGSSVNFEGVHAETSSTTTSGLAAFQMNANSGTAASLCETHRK